MKKFRHRIALIICLPTLPFLALGMIVSGDTEEVKFLFQSWVEGFLEGKA